MHDGAGGHFDPNEDFEAAVYKDLGFTPEQIQHLLLNVDKMSDDEVVEIHKLVDELEARKVRRLRQMDLIEFIQHIDPDYKVGAHHRKLAEMLMAIERGDKDRICVNIPPRHGKSQMVSIYFPAWFLGRNPGKKVMMVSHTTDLAVDFGRKVRNLINMDAYKEVFGNVSLAHDSKSAGRWNTNFGGEYFACGIGSALAGRGADLLLIDDPHSEQDVLNGNFEVFDRAYEWYAYGARTRLMPGGRVAIIQCMTGDTPVMRPDGSETPLRDLKPGDMVASYDSGALVSRKILNHTSNGLDSVFTIKTTSLNTVRANARHPFLVQRECGVQEWVRLKDLKVGDTLVSLRDAAIPDGQKQNLASAAPVNQETRTTAKTQTRRIVSWGIGVNTKARHVRTVAATNPRTPQGFVKHITTRNVGPKDICGVRRSRLATLTSSIAMVSHWRSTIRCLLSRADVVLSVANPPLAVTPGPIGGTSCALTTATTPVKYERSSVTTVTSQSGTLRPAPQPLLSQSISDFTLTTITSIEFSGVEEVFDVQVEGTENFIANSIVSHNTRWHMDDLTGRVVKDMAQNPGSDQFEVVEFPAILDLKDDKGKPYQKALWPEFFDLTALERTKASMPVFQWNAQYQQNPTAEEGSIIKREWWLLWPYDDPPPCEYIIMSLDAAAETHNRADFTALTTWGVFLNEETDSYNLVLLNSIKQRLEFPELKRLCIDEYSNWEPDAFIVEKKSAGTAIYQEMRRSGIPVQEYTPHRGTGDKMARLNSVADIVSSGFCWVPPKRWAEELVEEVAGFPFMSHDDLVDSTVMALLRFRQGGFLRLPTDDFEDDPIDMTPVAYY